MATGCGCRRSARVGSGCLLMRSLDVVRIVAEIRNPAAVRITTGA
jgi:hypothetical protein